MKKPLSNIKIQSFLVMALLALIFLTTSCESTGGASQLKQNLKTGNFLSTGFTSNIQYGEEITINKELPIIILKLDDLRKGMGMFPKVAELVIEKKIKAGFGVNGVQLVKAKLSSPLVESMIEWHYSGWIEIWHHGWDHSKDPDRLWYEYQARHLDKRPAYEDITSKKNFGRQYRDFANTQAIVKAKSGITMHSFGSPYNHNDMTFNKVVNMFPDIKLIMFSRTPVKNQLNLDISRDRLNLETSSGTVDYHYFLENYEDFYMKNEVAVLQAHPMYFDLMSFGAFKKVIEFLVEKGHTFMTPYEYYLYKTEGKTPRYGSPSSS